eukprot:CAMPEP_0168799286 /NCGR_PEP_ID=MMETSP0725-20121227/18348_1 /TAXON_ID=265536 /ORGANISM="Amphiprora sp., Strain CCMP467" /LENGTH=130 /DNA_ID=CAMNT_0008850739 /DNA_START=32 /DNA_END=424 /DNA_ORIENTATION=-
MADNSDITWEKPAWAKGGVALKKTAGGENGGEKLKSGSTNLAADITSAPHKKPHNFQTPGWTEEAGSGEKPLDLAKPITNIRETGDKNLAFEKPEWTKTKVLKESDKGGALKSGQEIARPIGGIKPVDEP